MAYRCGGVRLFVLFLLLGFAGCGESDSHAPDAVSAPPGGGGAPPPPPPPPPGGAPIFDSLNGSTIGNEIGAGEFVAGGGWRSTGGKIEFDAGQALSRGYFEARMRGWTAPAQGADKSHPLSGWESRDRYSHHREPGSFWNWRIGTGYTPFKVLAAPQAIATRVEARVGSNGEVNDGQAHTYRVEWSSGVVAFLFDGKVLKSWTFPDFKVRYFLIGQDDQYSATNPAPIISDVRIGPL